MYTMKFSSIEVNGVEIQHVEDYVGIHINDEGRKIRLDTDLWKIEVSEDTGNIHIYKGIE